MTEPSSAGATRDMAQGVLPFVAVNFCGGGADEPVVIDDRRAAWRAKMARVGGGLGLGLTIVLVATVWVLEPTRRELAVVLILAAASAVVLPALVRLVP